MSWIANRKSTLWKRLYAEAYSAFSAERYRRAEDLASQILLSDPGNEHATEMRDLAQEARHRKTNEQNTRDLREQWMRTFEDLETLALPQTESIVLRRSSLRLLLPLTIC